MARTKWLGSITNKLKSEHVIAAATVVLIIITGWYTFLTNKLLQLQVDPSLDISVAEPFEPSGQIVLRNTGPHSVNDVTVNLRCFVFKDATDISPSVLFNGFPSRGQEHSWWFIPEIAGGQAFNKDASEPLIGFLTNAERQRSFVSHTAGSTMTAREKLDGRKHQALQLRSYQLFVVDVSYHRAVDNKAYRVSLPFWLFKDANTGKPFLDVTPISTEYRQLLETMYR